MAVSSLNGARAAPICHAGAEKASASRSIREAILPQPGQPPAEAKWVVPRLLLGGACRHPRDRRTLHAARPEFVETDSFLATCARVRQQGYIALLSDRVVAHYAPAALHLQKIPTQEIDISARLRLYPP
ncbi:hypothetical protein M8494_25200 [Serratia ureilytica]